MLKKILKRIVTNVELLRSLWFWDIAVQGELGNVQISYDASREVCSNRQMGRGFGQTYLTTIFYSG